MQIATNKKDDNFIDSQGSIPATEVVNRRLVWTTNKPRPDRVTVSRVLSGA